MTPKWFGYKWETKCIPYGFRLETQVTSKEISIYNSHITDKKLKEFSTKEDLMLMNSLIVRWANYVGVETPEASQINMLA
jgi:hypothetical protein